MSTIESINPVTDRWIEVREAEVQYRSAGLKPEAMPYGLTEDEVYAAIDLLTAEISDIHRSANLSLPDAEQVLNAIRYASLYLLSTL